ncbi:MAG: exonuclease domain-containing protein [Paenibacillaceae bacterium]
MADQLGPVGRMWNIYKKGGITPAVASVFGSNSAQQMAFIRSAMKLQRQTSLFDLPLKSLEVVVFDLETTGFNPYNGDEIISFGGVMVSGSEIHESQTYHSLVNPQKPIPAMIQELTGITKEMAEAAPDLIEVLQHFFEFVQKKILIAHGTGHDKQFLNAALWKTSKVNLTHRVLDTMMIAKWLHPDLKNYDLDCLLNLYEIPITTRHHALEDSLMTAQLWVKFIAEITDRQVITLGDLYMYLSRH